MGGVRLQDSLYQHPQIHVKSASYIGTVYGGGSSAEVVGDTYINIGTQTAVNWETLVSLAAATTPTSRARPMWPSGGNNL